MCEPTLNELLARLERDLNVFDLQNDRLQVEGTVRNRLAGALLDLAQEQAKAIVRLVQLNFIGAASALFRSLAEAYVRGVWVLDSANEATVLRLCERDGGWPDFERMRQDIGQLDELTGRIWGALNSYTHGGLSQLGRRATEDEIRPLFTEIQIKEIVAATGELATAAQARILGLAAQHRDRNA